jgi:Icc-related predicted phosphoesterase
MLTVVMKLFLLVRPAAAVFGHIHEGHGCSVAPLAATAANQVRPAASQALR